MALGGDLKSGRKGLFSDPSPIPTKHSVTPLEIWKVLCHLSPNSEHPSQARGVPAVVVVGVERGLNDRRGREGETDRHRQERLREGVREAQTHMGEVRELEFAFDIASPYAYLASKQIEGVALRTGATLLWTPVLLEDLYNLNGRGFLFVCLFVCFSFLVHPLSISTLF